MKNTFWAVYNKRGKGEIETLRICGNLKQVFDKALASHMSKTTNQHSKEYPYGYQLEAFELEYEAKMCRGSGRHKKAKPPLIVNKPLYY